MRICKTCKERPALKHRHTCNRCENIKRVKRSKEKNRKVIDLVNDYKVKQGCQQCGENHVACLDFHHLSREDKDFTISSAIYKNIDFAILWKEIQKCIVLCSNCHRKLHYYEGKSEEQG